MLVWKRTVSIFNTEYELQEKHSLFLPFFNLSCRILPQNDIQLPVFIIQNELTFFQNGCIIEIDGTERGCFRSFRNKFSNFRIFYNKHTRKEDAILCVKQFVPCWVSSAERWRLRSEAGMLPLPHWYSFYHSIISLVCWLPVFFAAHQKPKRAVCNPKSVGKGWSKKSWCCCWYSQPLAWTLHCTRIICGTPFALALPAMN